MICAHTPSSGRVTVVLPTYNRADLLTRAIRSALAQSVAGRCDIVVVDDGSTDHTPQAVTQFAGQLIYLRQRNAGVSAARNAAIRARPNEFIAFLDSDDEWTPTALERQLAALRRWPHVGFVAGHALCRGPGGRLTPVESVAVPADRPVDLAPHLFERCVIQTPTVMVRHACLARTGLFHPDLRNCGDHELWTRLACSRPAVYLSATLAVFSREPLERLTGDPGRAFHADVRARYRMRHLLRCRPDCRPNWQRGLARSLQVLRDHAFRDRRYAAAARYALCSLAAWPHERARWEWGRAGHALVRSLLA